MKPTTPQDLVVIVADSDPVSLSRVCGLLVDLGITAERMICCCSEVELTESISENSDITSAIIFNDNIFSDAVRAECVIMVMRDEIPEAIIVPYFNTGPAAKGLSYILSGANAYYRAGVHEQDFAKKLSDMRDKIEIACLFSDRRQIRREIQGRAYEQ